MSKTIEQLRAEASIIEEATRQGENTQLRVGGLFQDIIDFIAQIPISETILGPLLQALNNSGLINPGDGQTLTFSLMKDGWTFSDALTQFQLKLGQISSTVTSNYEAFIQTRDMLQREVDATDQRVRSYKTDYDNSQIEYATWKSQTDTSISQYAVAIDKVSGDIISISGRVDTAYDQLDFVTNNLEAADKALEKLFNLTGLDYEDPEEAYTASWLYKNRQGIYGAAATFDESGNIIQSSVLGADIRGIRADVSNMDGRVASLRIDVDGITTRVTNVEGTYSSIQQEATRLAGLINTIDGKVAGLEVTAVKKDPNSNYITNARLSADYINFQFSERWSVQNAQGTEVMYLDPNGNLTITGEFSGKIKGEVVVGEPGYCRMFIQNLGSRGAALIGQNEYNSEVLSLGFLNDKAIFRLGQAHMTETQLYLEGYPYTNNIYLDINDSTGRPELILRNGSNRTNIYIDENGYTIIQATKWPRESGIPPLGGLYVDGDGIVKLNRG